MSDADKESHFIRRQRDLPTDYGTGISRLLHVLLVNDAHAVRQ